MLARPVYLDNHATTRCDPRVFDAMRPYFCDLYGNAASTSHAFGWQAAEAVDRARQQLASLLGADEREIVFTSGATEANNLAIKGVAASQQRKGRHLVTAAAEHPAVLDPVRRLEREGWSVTILPVSPTGAVDPAHVRSALTDQTVLVSIMAANNEVGTLNPIREIGQLCRERNIWFHTDATQAVGKIPLDVEADSIDLLSLSAHKFYGPKGIGALYVRRREPRVRLTPLFDGGGHERGFRSGTPAVPLIVGLGHAAALAAQEMQNEAIRIAALRDRLQAGLTERIEAIRINGDPSRLPGNLNVSFEYVDGEALILSMRDLAVSSGAACSSADPEPSHVLRAMGLDDDLARASVRFGLGRFTTLEEIDFAIDSVTAAVAQLRTSSPAWQHHSST